MSETIACNLGVICKTINGEVKFLEGHPMRDYHWGTVTAAAMFVYEGGYRGRMPEGSNKMSLHKAIQTLRKD